MVGLFTVTTFNRENITSYGMATKFAYGFGSMVGHRPKINKLVKNLLATRYCTALKKKVCTITSKKKAVMYVNSGQVLWQSVDQKN